MSTGAAITLIAVGAILRFALAGSPHGLIRGDDWFFAPDVPGCEEDDF